MRRLEAASLTTSPSGIPDRFAGAVHGAAGIADGISVITEKIFPDRFLHVAELERLGATPQGRLDGDHPGQKNLSGAPVMASDLRASAALVIAGLIAKGTTR